MTGGAGLRVLLPLPTEVVAVGAGQVVVLAGEVRHRTSPVTRAWVDIGTGRQRLHVRPKPPEDAAGGRGARHRARVRGRLIVPRGVGPEAPVTLLVELRDGSLLAHDLGVLRTAKRRTKPLEVAWPADGARVAVCLATYRPRREWLAQQLDSLRAQTHRNWVCVISDDGSGEPYVRAIRELIAGDERFLLLDHADNLGVYGNFERALGAAPRDADFVAYSDQDDVWDADKLTTLLAHMGPGVQLAYADMRLIDADGKPLADTFWGHRVNKHDDLIALSTLNTVTGAACLFRGDLARRQILPFPPAVGAYHDHWTAIVAAATGRIAFVDRPLQSYRQHEAAVTGYQREDADSWLPSSPRLVRALRAPEVLTPRERWHLDRIAREDLTRLATFAAVTAERFGPRLSAADRRWLAQLADADRRVLPTIALAARGRRYRRTNRGAERVLATSAVWQAVQRHRRRHRQRAGATSDSTRS